ncbi:hypothetical protein NDU88_004929 [Pleurodeles waltl]|uniref:Uncharacterized protein n=1 Tax=Pleurodeles waltl TaxID=8319 RepID=A0AAV7M9K5_PLEWA|nr:hypothetical protein NDU88_004929 [Pleurodeles waltl]
MRGCGRPPLPHGVLRILYRPPGGCCVVADTPGRRSRSRAPPGPIRGRRGTLPIGQQCDGSRRSAEQAKRTGGGVASTRASPPSQAPQTGGHPQSLAPHLDAGPSARVPRRHPGRSHLQSAARGGLQGCGHQLLRGLHSFFPRASPHTSTPDS